MFEWMTTAMIIIIFATALIFGIGGYFLCRWVTLKDYNCKTDEDHIWGRWGSYREYVDCEYKNGRTINYYEVWEKRNCKVCNVLDRRKLKK